MGSVDTYFVPIIVVTGVDAVGCVPILYRCFARDEAMVSKEEK